MRQAVQWQRRAQQPIPGQSDGRLGVHRLIVVVPVFVAVESIVIGDTHRRGQQLSQLGPPDGREMTLGDEVLQRAGHLHCSALRVLELDRPADHPR